MKLSIIIPVYNEEQTIASVIDAVFAVDLPDIEKEIIIVNDGSADNTVIALEQAAERYPLVVVHHAVNKGKGAAIRTGVTRMTGELGLIQDADMEYSPKDYPALLEPFTGGASVVYGVRTHKPAGRGYWHYIAGAYVLDTFASLLYGVSLRDTYTGFKVFRKEVFETLGLKSSGFEIEAEITAKLAKRQTPITYVPVSYFPRSFVHGKKIRPSDAFKGAWTLIKIRWS